MTAAVHQPVLRPGSTLSRLDSFVILINKAHFSIIVVVGLVEFFFVCSSVSFSVSLVVVFSGSFRVGIG